jgi:hypothetical protein
MGKAKAVARKRRPYEYDHHYGLRLRAARPNRGGGSPGAGKSPRPAKPMTIKKAAKKR